jgi:hypothetical protein
MVCVCVCFFFLSFRQKIFVIAIIRKMHNHHFEQLELCSLVDRSSV